MAFSSFRCVGGDGPLQQAASALTNPAGLDADDALSRSTGVLQPTLPMSPNGCGATLLTAEWILTAGHCLQGPLGTNPQVTFAAPAGMAATFAVDMAQCWIHPRLYFRSPTLPDNRCGQAFPPPAPLDPSAVTDPRYDVALAHLARPVPRLLALPRPVLLRNVRPDDHAWVGAPVTLIGTTNGVLPTARQVGFNVIADIEFTTPSPFFDDHVANTILLRDASRSLVQGGDSGSPMLWDGASPASAFVRRWQIGVASQSNGFDRSKYAATWNTPVATWIHNVLTGGDTSAFSDTTPVTLPTSWRGEGSDADRTLPDGTPRSGDNCPELWNPWQYDDDGDGRGNECDVDRMGRDRHLHFDPDTDGDRIPDDEDNCPLNRNPDQADADGDGWGDLCDLCAHTRDPARRSTQETQPNCNQAGEGALGRPALGDSCDPYPCDPVNEVHTAEGALTDCVDVPDFPYQQCLQHAGPVHLGLAPRVGTPERTPNPSPTPVDGRLVSPVWRCVCLSEDGVEATSRLGCLSGEAGREFCQQTLQPTRRSDGLGWYVTRVDHFGSAPVSTQVWSGQPGERAARLEYPRAAFGAGGLTSWYDLDAYWRDTNAVAFDNWNWLPDVDSLPVGLRVPGLLNLSSPRFVLWSRAQTLEDSSDPAASPATRERAALQDHYAPGWFPVTPNHVVTRPWRVVLAEYNELRAVLPSISVWRFPCPLSRAEVVGRNRPVLYPLEQGANSKLSAGFFPSKDPTSTTVGVMVGILDVRQGVLTGLERTEGAPGELPTAGALSLASSRLAEDGWPDVYAFGGVEGGTYSAALFYTTHASVPAVVGLAAAAAAGPPASEGATTVRYTWHRAAFSRQPPGRRDAAFVVNGDASRVYVLGGRNGSGALADGWAYDFALRDWVPLPPLRGLAARYDAGAVGFGDLVYLGGGTDSRGRTLGDLFVVDGLTGHTQALGNVLPLGARPSLSFDEHYDGLFYAGGTVGGTTRRDLWYVRLGAARASRARLVYDFGSGGMGAAESFAVQADLEHGLYWGLPGYGASPAPIRVVRTNLPSRGSRGEGDEDEHDDRGPERHGNEADAPPCYVVRGAAGSPRVPR